jgi:hypothetical protein
LFNFYRWSKDYIAFAKGDLKMIELEKDISWKISGGKDSGDFYNQVIVPGVGIGGTIIGGPGGGMTAVVGLYGVEGFVESIPGAINSLEQMNTLSDAQVAAIMADPYWYPD